MRNIKVFGAVCAAFVLAAAPATAQGIIGPVPPLFSGGTAIGPDGTYYAVVPGPNSTFQSPVTELMAVGLGATPKWTYTLTAQVGQVLPGATSVFVVETTFTGSGRSLTNTTSVLVLSVSGGTKTTSIAPAGNIYDIQVRDINGSDYLYIYTFTTSSGTGVNPASYSVTRMLTIYSANGTIFKSASL